MGKVKKILWDIHDYTLAIGVCILFVAIQMVCFLWEYEEKPNG
jgi:heme/copper-type cytochrome/quinol oxidase subunit 2